MDFKNQSYYDILEVGPNASFNEIKTAYYRIKSTYSKDSPALYTLFNEDETKELLAKIEIAYLVLSNGDKRKEYDRTHGFLTALDESSNQKSKDNSNEATDGLDLLGIENLGINNTSQNLGVFGSFGGFGNTKINQAPQKPKITTNFYTEPSNEMPQQSPISVPPLSQPQKGNDNNITSAIPPHIPVKENVLSVIRRHNIAKPHADNPETEKQIAEEKDFHGDFLRFVREYRNITIEEISDFTKISKTYLHAIEEENFKKLPARVFVRGFVSQVAKSLKLNSDQVVNAYMKYYDSAVKK